MSQIEIIDPKADWLFPVIERVEIVDCGRAVGVLLKERDGTISAIRISVEQLAD